MLPENRAFMIKGDDGEEYGPVDLPELSEWVRENRAGLGTEVRLDESGAIWQSWQYYPELVALLAEAQVTTPGLSKLVIAPLSRRILASVLDLILNTILVVPFILIAILIGAPDWFIHYSVASFLGQTPLPATPLPLEITTTLISNGALALYLAGFIALHGQTPAKAILRLRVVDKNGDKPSVARSLLRGLCIVISIFPLFYLIGVASLSYAMFNPQRRTFHDLVAGTYVVEA